MSLTFLQDPARGTTVVEINIDGMTYTGSAKTSPEDSFNPEVGIQIAYARALAEATRVAKRLAETTAREPIFSRPKTHKRKRAVAIPTETPKVVKAKAKKGKKKKVKK